MILKTPNLLNHPEFLLAPLDYKWNKKVLNTIDEIGNSKLLDIIVKINQKATLGLATAFAEWIFWRLKNSIEVELNGEKLESYFLVAEAHWVGLIDRKYIKNWNYNVPFPDGKIAQPLWNTLNYLDMTRGPYIDGNYYIYNSIDSLAMLARQVTPNDFIPVFEQWLTSVIQKAIQLFPATYDITEIINEKDYDPSIEPFIPREFFFDINFNYETADLAQIQRTLLANTHWQENRFLNTPDEMIELGFVGTPYQYNGE